MKPKAAAAVLIALVLGLMLSACTDDTPAPPSAVRSALFVGDSYAAGGYPGVTKDQAFPCPTAKELGWLCFRDAIGATGYQADGKLFWPGADTYENRLPNTRLTYPDPDVIVVSGGRNDQTPAIGTASLSYLRALAQAYPSARIFVLEPFWIGPVTVDVTQARSAVKASAEAAGVTWVPTADWLAPTDLSGDWVHPNLRGQQHITQRLVAVLQAATAA